MKISTDFDFNFECVGALDLDYFTSSMTPETSPASNIIQTKDMLWDTTREDPPDVPGVSVSVVETVSAEMTISGITVPESQEEPSQEMDDQVQDEIDALMDAEEEGGAAFIQKSQSRSFGGFMRRVGVFFMTLFLVLVCATSVAIIAVILTYIVMSLIITIPAGPAGMGVGMGLAMDSLAYGLVGGGVIGLAGCASQLYSNFATIH